MEQIVKLKRTWNLAPTLQIFQKIHENYCPCLYLSIGQVCWLNELWFKRYIQKWTLSHLLILIMTLWLQICQIMKLFKITKLKYFENWTLSVPLITHLRSYPFVAEVTFKMKRPSLILLKRKLWMHRIVNFGSKHSLIMKNYIGCMFITVLWKELSKYLDSCNSKWRQ